MIYLTLYTSPTCMPCHILAGRIEALAQENPDNIFYAREDITENNPLNISGTPYLIIKKDKEEIFNGHVSNLAQTLKQIKELIH